MPPGDVAFVAALLMPGVLVVSGTLVAEKVAYRDRGRPLPALRVACLLAPPLAVVAYLLVSYALLGAPGHPLEWLWLVAGVIAGGLSVALGLAAGFFGRRFVA